MDFEKYAKQLMQSDRAAALEKLTQSETAAGLARQFDGSAVEKAAREGDSKALSALLRQVLSTPEGKSFAAQVQKAVKKDGQ